MPEPERDVATITNRLPIRFSVDHDTKEITIENSDGGVVNGLWGTQNWFGYLEPISEMTESVMEEVRRLGLHPVLVPQEIYKKYYGGAINRVLWPVLHSMPEYIKPLQEYFVDWWNAVEEASQLFLQVILEHIEDGYTVWVHDLHLFRLLKMLRECGLNIGIGFFLHIPWPTLEVFRELPEEWQEEIVDCMLSADFVGMHTEEYVANFLSTVEYFKGPTALRDNNMIFVQDRLVGVGVLPLSLNVGNLHRESRFGECEGEFLRLLQRYGNLELIVGIDRLDLIKGLLHKIRGFRRYLLNNPDQIGKVSLLQVVVPSREDVPECQELKRQLEILVEEVNAEFGSAGYVPVIYWYTHVDTALLFALYRRANPGIVNSLVDGLNLVAVELIAAKGGEDPGVLILSKKAGIYEQLKRVYEDLAPELAVNPYSEEDLARAIEVARTMPIKEQKALMKALYEVLLPNTNEGWKEDFLNGVDRVRELNSA